MWDSAFFGVDAWATDWWNEDAAAISGVLLTRDQSLAIFGFDELGLFEELPAESLATDSGILIGLYPGIEEGGAFPEGGGPQAVTGSFIGAPASFPVPVAYWPFNEGTGATAADASGSGHTLTLGATASWNTSVKKFGTASLSNTGATNHGACSAISLGTVQSLSFWAHNVGISGLGSGVAGGGAAVFDEMCLFVYPNYLWWFYSGVVPFEFADKSWETDGWHHIAMVRDGTVVTCYVDGATGSPASGTTDTAPVSVSVIGFEIEATLDDVRLYNVALTADEVAALSTYNPDLGGALVYAPTVTLPTEVSTDTIGPGSILTVTGEVNSATQNFSFGTRTWSNLSNVLDEDGAVSQASASSTGDSVYLTATDCFFDLPPNAVITGIRVRVRAKATTASGGGSVTDTRVRLIKGSTIQTTDKSSGDPWSLAGFEDRIYGGLSDLWGLTWTPADLDNTPTFGVALSAHLIGFTSNVTAAQVDCIVVTVGYYLGAVLMAPTVVPDQVITLTTIPSGSALTAPPLVVPDQTVTLTATIASSSAASAPPVVAGGTLAVGLPTIPSGSVANAPGPTFHLISVYIEGVDVTEFFHGLANIELDLNSPTQADVSITNWTRDEYVPALGNEVVIRLANTPLFGGYVDTVQDATLVGNHPQVLTLSCVGYGILPTRRFVTAVDGLTFPDYTSLETVVTSLVATYLSGDGIVADVPGGPLLTGMTWGQYARLDSVLNDLSSASGWVWQITPAKELQFFLPGVESAPFVLGEPNPAYISPSLTIEESMASPYRNRQYIIVGRDEDPHPVTEVYYGNGATRFFVFANPTNVMMPTSVTVNRLVGGETVYTLGLNGWDPPGAFQWNFVDKLKLFSYPIGWPGFYDGVVQATTDTLLSVFDSVSATWDVKFPLTVVDEDTAGVAAHGAVTDIVLAEDAFDIRLGQSMAAALLARYAITTKISFRTRQSAFVKPGQALTVHLDEARGINDEFVIQQVSLTMIDSYTFEATATAINAATYKGSFLDTYRSWTGGGGSGAVPGGTIGGTGGAGTVPFGHVDAGGSRTSANYAVDNTVWYDLVDYNTLRLNDLVFGGLTTRMRLEARAPSAVVASFRLLDIATGVEVGSYLSFNLTSTWSEITFAVNLQTGWRTYKLQIKIHTTGIDVWTKGTFEAYAP